MQNSLKKSVRQSVFLLAVMATLLIGVTVAVAFRFKAAGQQPNQQPNQPANQPATSPPRPAITMVSPEDAAREMNNPRSKIRIVHSLGPLRDSRRDVERTADSGHRRMDNEPRQGSS